ncbi:U4/U6.U5 tri-snRNP-associated protein [Chytriomyces sp. MP71]|nr:U4/U6.U5 tri-snRNP-associated protein [Chytriomyces sp. MP71]
MPGSDQERGAHADEVDEVDEERRLSKRRRVAAESETSGLYLDTVNRSVLDFDFETLCSVSLAPLNVYACLVCGKYFGGRGEGTHAYTHALSHDHHVFINLTTLRTYCLPEAYEIHDASLADIKYVIRPFYSRDQIAALDTNTAYSYDLNNKAYLPGFVGLNNIKHNDYINVVLQVLAHVPPLRDFLLGDDCIDVVNGTVTVSAFPAKGKGKAVSASTISKANATVKKSSELAVRFASLVRKVWNPRGFKGQVSPHELLQEITNASGRQFLLTAQSDPADFLAWFLNSLHMGLGGSPKKNGSSVIHAAFQGEVMVHSQAIAEGASSAETGVVQAFEEGKETTTTKSPFLFLSLDLPPAPLFQDEVERNIIPQVPLTQLLQKYDGVTDKEYTQSIKRFRLTKLPRYLLFHIKRFTKNNFTTEKNATIVNFPIRGLDMREYLDPAANETHTTYNLLANILHDGKPGATEGAYKAHVHCKGRDQWLQVQDLIVEEVAAEMLFLGESYLQVWERMEA